MTRMRPAAPSAAAGMRKSSSVSHFMLTESREGDLESGGSTRSLPSFAISNPSLKTIRARKSSSESKTTKSAL